MGANSDLMQWREAAVVRGIGHSTQVFAARAKNAEIWDAQGRRYIDFAGRIVVLPLSLGMACYYNDTCFIWASAVTR